MFKKAIEYFKSIKRLFGYEKVTVISVKKTGNMYSTDDNINVNREWRKFYKVNMGNVVYNVKNYMKYVLKRDFDKMKDGKPYYKYIYTHKRFAYKKNDFAVIPNHLLKISKEPREMSMRTVGFIDRETLKK